MKTVPIRPEAAPVKRLLEIFAGNRATLVLLVILALGILLYYRTDWNDRMWLIALPALLLCANFLLALASRGIMRRKTPLLVFHFALIALVLLAIAGHLSRFSASLELAVGERFNGQLENRREGPLHRYGLERVEFTNLGFSIRYHAGIKREKTRNRIALNRADGATQIIEIGDHLPLVAGHYRFYTSHNKGYAPVFEWRPRGSHRSRVGSIHLPAFPTHRFGQALEWRIPGSDLEIWTMLQIDEEVLPLDRAFDFSLPQRHRLVVRYRDARHELRPGDTIDFPQGSLRYRELSSWMGYRVDYDMTRPWMLAAALIGLLALMLHYVEKFGWLRIPRRLGDYGRAGVNSSSVRQSARPRSTARYPGTRAAIRRFR